MTAKEALKRLKQETAPATYMPDFDKDKCIEIINQEFERLEALEKENQELKELVEFLIKHLYVAPELLELRVAPKHNHIWDGWRHNGIKVQNDDFWKHIKLINKLKKEIGNYE